MKPLHFTAPRRLIRRFAITTLTFAISGISVAQAQTQPLTTNANIHSASRPNIIFFLVDDMGWQDTSLPFWTQHTRENSEFFTPNMVKLATKSMKFVNAYSNSICTPSRVSLMTGMNAARHRVTNWTMLKDQSVDAPDKNFKPPKWNVNGLSPVPGVERTVYATPLFQVLKDAGYYTIHCGKAHFAAYKTLGADPINLGADINIGGSAAGNPASYLGESDYGNVPGRFILKAVPGKNQISRNVPGKFNPPRETPGTNEYWKTQTFLTKALTLQAMKAMGTALAKKQPFFLYMAQFAVHEPYNHDARYFEKYRRRGLPAPEAAYAALVEGMDTSLGTLRQYLKDHHIENNTIIIFMSDNGGLALPPRKGKPGTQNAPLSYGKGSLYEGGIREPMMVDWPGVTRPGSVAQQYVDMQDFYPTILAMAGIKNYHTVQKVDGISMVPILKNPNYTDNTRALVWNFPNAWGESAANGVHQGYDWQSAIRQGDWKLIYFQNTGKKELYNLKSDIGEQDDLSATYPAKVQQLAKLLTQKFKTMHAQMPINKKTGKTVPWPDGSADTEQ